MNVKDKILLVVLVSFLSIIAGITLASCYDTRSVAPVCKCERSVEGSE